MESYDVIIVGGGMVGGALGCALGDLGFRVAVVEAREPAVAWPPDSVEARTSALTRASELVLRNLGVWERMQGMRVSPYREMHVWDAGGFGEIHFDSAEIGEPDLGHIVENRVIQRALWERLGEIPSVTRLCPASVTAVDLTGPQPRLRVVDYDGEPTPATADGSTDERPLAAGEGAGDDALAKERSLTAALIVAADGAQSRVRAMAGLGTRGWAYDQHAVVAIVRPARHHQATAWQHFLPTGPIALLPIEDGRCNVVWSTSPEHAMELKAMGDAQFCRAVEGATQSRLGPIRETGPREVFPLRLQHAEHYVEEGLALVGDAAHAIHPLAGQGVNLGLLDAAALTDVLAQARYRSRPLGSMTMLRRYERARKGANLAMMSAMDVFKRLFSNDNPALYLARNLGMRATDLAAPVKHAIMRRALGVSGERPSLARRQSL
jgi:2-octaprenylphenol hydroxylase